SIEVDLSTAIHPPFGEPDRAFIPGRTLRVVRRGHGRTPISAEGEGIGLDVGVQKPDFESVIGDRTILTSHAPTPSSRKSPAPSCREARLSIISYLTMALQTSVYGPF